jgi:hypothetical protein
MKQQIGVAASGVGHRRKRDGVGRVATAYTTGTKPNPTLVRVAGPFTSLRFLSCNLWSSSSRHALIPKPNHLQRILLYRKTSPAIHIRFLRDSEASRRGLLPSDRITSPRSGRVRCNKLFAVPEAQDEEL